MTRIALISFHGCPVVQLGRGYAGGMNVYVLQSARQLGAQGKFVDIYTRRHDSADPEFESIDSNVRVIHVDAGSYSQEKNDLYEYLPDFQKGVLNFQRAWKINYDLVHSHYWLSGCAGTVIAQEWNVPHVVNFHTIAKSKLESRIGEKEPNQRLVSEPQVSNQSDMIVASTQSEKEDLKRFFKLKDSKISVISPGVDLDLFKPINKYDARKSLGFCQKYMVLSVGRIDPIKGLDILIGTMELLSDSVQASLVIVGGDLEKDREIERLKSVAIELGLEGKVFFTGAVDQRELSLYYSAADVLALPSYYESFGLVALEAMACGTPIIASRVGGPKSFIKSGQNGYLVPWHCPEPYAQRLEILFNNPSLLNSMSDAAIRKAKTMGWDKVTNKLIQLYECLILKQ